MTAADQGLREAIILAGGRGTRLASVLTQQKVTAEVDGTPFVMRLVRWLATFGIERVVLAAGHRVEDVEALVKAHGTARPELAISQEKEPLGTAGAIRLAADKTSADTVLVMNGDSIAEIDLPSLYQFHTDRQALVTLALVAVPDPSRYSFVEMGPDGAILQFHEKPDTPRAGAWINGGIYLFERCAFEEIPAGRPASLEFDVFPRLIGRGLYGKQYHARFIDIGTPESLIAAGSFFAKAMPHDH